MNRKRTTASLVLAAVLAGASLIVATPAQAASSYWGYSSPSRSQCVTNTSVKLAAIAASFKRLESRSTSCKKSWSAASGTYYSSNLYWH